MQVCARRNCDPGWKCDCEGDYFCDVADIDVYTLIDQNDNLLTTDVPCQVITQQTVTSSGFKLGYFQPQFSDKGLLDQQCQTFAWFLDGVLQDSFDTLTAVSNTNLETVKTSLGDWNLLPLRSGSVIGTLRFLRFQPQLKHIREEQRMRMSFLFCSLSLTIFFCLHFWYLTFK